MNSNIENFSILEKVFSVCMYLSKLHSKDPLYRKNRKSYYETLADFFDMPFRTITNYQDELDPYFENGRKGWHQKPLEKRNKRLFAFFERYKDTPVEELGAQVTQLIKNIESSARYYHIQLLIPLEGVSPQQELTVRLDESPVVRRISVGDLLFVTGRGNLTSDHAEVESGVLGIGRVTGITTDMKSYEIEIRMVIQLERPLTREDLIPYRGLFDLNGIGPMTKPEDERSISFIETSKAVHLVRAIVDRYPTIEAEFIDLFDEPFIEAVWGGIEILIPHNIAYGEGLKRQDGQAKHVIKNLVEEYIMNVEHMNSKFIIDEEILSTINTYINLRKHIILSGPPGTGKTTIADQLALNGIEINYIHGRLLTTATSEWSTFDTIGGYMPDLNSQLKFQEGIVLRSIRENSWLIIDEINRAEIDKAFGQLFTVLSGKDVQLPFINNDSGRLINIKHYDGLISYYEPKTSTYFVGKNWRIIATMNTFDKNSLFDLSLAFMRRFAFIEIPIPAKKHMDLLVDQSNAPYGSKQVLKRLLSVTPRPLGPAIIKELTDYLERTNGSGIVEAICGLVLPQFEGLTSQEQIDFYRGIGSNLNDVSRSKLRAFLTGFFDIRNVEKLDQIDREFRDALQEQQTTELA